MNQSEKPIVGFTFQEIPLEEALNVVLAGDGNYSDIKQALLERLPQLPPDKAYAFGLPNGKEVAEQQRRGLCMAMNATLKRAKILWRVTYSSAKKIFICIPKSTKQVAPAHKEDYRPQSKYYQSEENDQIILNLWKQGLTVREITHKTGIPMGRVNYLCYNIHPRKSLGKTTAPQPAPIEHSNGATDAQSLVNLARAIFNYSGDFKNSEGKAIRKAISIVGVNDLNIHSTVLAPLIGLTYQGVYFNAHSAKSNLGMKQISALRKAIKQEGKNA